MDQHQRVVWKQRIEIALVQRAAIGETVGVVAVGHQPLPRLQRIGLHMLLQHLLQRGNRGDRPGRGPLDIGPLHHLQGIGEMPVGIDETRQQGASLEIQLAGVRAGMGQHLILRANGNDASACDGDRLSAGMRRLHREDGASRENQLGNNGHSVNVCF